MKPLGNQRGQMITEAILILVMLMGFTLAISQYLKNEEVLKKLITGPWVSLSGMLQNGVWAAPADGAVSHPNGHYRHIVIQGELGQ